MTIRKPSKAIKIFLLTLLFNVFSALAIACGDTDDSSDDQDSSADIGHQFEPTDEMINLAKQQCLEGDKSEGVVEAKDPTTGEILSKAVVNCR